MLVVYTRKKTPDPCAGVVQHVLKITINDSERQSLILDPWICRSPFNAPSPLKAAVLLKYVWPFSGHQALWG